MQYRTLHARFLRAVLGLSAVLSVVASVVVFQVARARFEQAERSSVQAMISAVDKSLAVGAYARDHVLLQELLGGLTRHPAVASAQIRDATGAMMLSAANPTAPDGTRTGDADIEVDLASPFDAKESLGHLRLWFDNARVSREARQQATLLVSALVVMMMTLLAAFNALAQRLLSRPMHRLAQTLAGITPGSNARVPVESRHADDEVGVVAQAANQLLELQADALARERQMREAIAAMEARYRGIFDSSTAGLVVLTMQGEVQHANPALWRLIGREAGALRSLSEAPLAEPDQLQRLIDRAQASMQAESCDLELVHPGGRQAWLHCMMTVVDDPASGQQHLEGVLYDVTRRFEHERAARHQAEHDALTGLKSRTYIEALLDARVDAARDQDGAVTLMFIDLDGFKAVNDRWGHAAGDAVLVATAQRLRTLFKRSSDVVGRLGGDELVVIVDGTHATDPTIGEMAARVVQRLKEPFDLPQGVQATIGASVGLASYPLHATSAATLIEAADAAMYAVKKAGKGGYVVAVTHDGAPPSLHKVEDKHDAADVDTVDALTGLADRRALARRLVELHAELAARGGWAAVMCVDLDHFKDINLGHGTRVGDEVLCETARRLRRTLREADTVARAGSDEFVALVTLDASDHDDAAAAVKAVTDKLRARLGEPFFAGSNPMGLQASIGLSFITPATTDAQAVLQEAELALQRAQSQRRGGAEIYEPGMMTGFLRQRSLEEDLRHAVAARQLRLYVQPQRDRTGGVCGGEALLRWEHPQRGLVLPGEFIALAEASGLIVDIGRWVLQEGCSVLARMQAQHAAHTLALNISPVQFKHPGFCTDVRAALGAAGARPDGLTLEITEGLLLTGVESVTERMAELAALGVRWSIDDFGTGFSSLAYLRQLALHEIKIDRSFIAGLPHDTASAGIVRSILSMGQHLGLRVVAEGVETQAQADFLRAHDCGRQQGYLHGRPMPAERFLASLSMKAAVLSAADAS